MYNSSNNATMMPTKTQINSIAILVVILLCVAITKSDAFSNNIHKLNYQSGGNNNSIDETKPDNFTVLDSGNDYFRFATVGDWGCTTETDKTVKNILGRNTNLVIGLGDYSYSDMATCWIDKIKPIQGLMKIVLGNHENVQNYALSVFDSLRFSTPDLYMDVFGLKKQFYSFDYGNVHFLMMSTEVPYERGSAQYNFTYNDLARASKDPNTKWIIVANHRTIYPPYFGPLAALDASIGKKFRDTYHPLFDLNGVDLVLQGHVHHYERTYPIKYNMSNSDTPRITDFHRYNYTDPSAPIFVTAGTGGVEIGHPDMITNPYYDVFSITRVFGILIIEINENGSDLKGTFYNNGIDGWPFPQDRFKISK